ncbi:hypothetical protein RFI_29645 [Reticulomyxa filosa]|uniref:ER-bound oxygenase mpaB/mpaB'/Rubber oxygenase catalytic domain-containing protein n=1 Tax=Reticulomyxa filosa TaxID=46433 RepID=X6M1I1_RETFI|nr:hypothetical protein RFI_29645 [Reticulomyxa filosa]|eukprot:ETO07744.1 hypothetical protein RFI_29645 [Reticulomyxa filosa]
MPKEDENEHDQATAMNTFRSKRFYGTFQYIFPISFGDRTRAFNSSKKVANLHAKIKGKFTENVGIYRRGDEYNAFMKHSIIWVGFTLFESQFLCRDMFLNSVSQYCQKEANQKLKEEVWKSAIPFFSAFGVEPSESVSSHDQQKHAGSDNININVLPRTYAECVKYLAHMCYCGELAVGSHAVQLLKSLSCHNNRSYLSKFKMWLLMWLTSFTLPRVVRDSINRQFGYSFLPTGKFEYVLFLLWCGLVRIFYRWLPDCFRLLHDYLRLKRSYQQQNAEHQSSDTVPTIPTKTFSDPLIDNKHTRLEAVGEWMSGRIANSIVSFSLKA